MTPEVYDPPPDTPTPPSEPAKKTDPDSPPRGRPRNGRKRDGLSDPESVEPVLFVAEDWTDFRNLDRITTKAGVPRDLLPRVAVKELVDNALDAAGPAGTVKYGPLTADDDAFGFFVADDGAGIKGTDADLATHFSIRRPLTTSKMKLMPTRGKLGNGIRVAVGVAILGRGTVRVSTRGRTLTLVPQADDGTTRVAAGAPWDGTGTRIEVTLLDPMAELARDDDDLFRWADTAVALNRGTHFRGETSPWWYTPLGFHDLLRAAGRERVARVFKTLSGCSASRKVARLNADYPGRTCDSLTAAESSAILALARDGTKAVPPRLLGAVGPLDDYPGYKKVVGVRADADRQVPYVLEAWARRSESEEVTVCVNRTPIVTEVSLQRDDRAEYAIYGAGLSHAGIAAGQKRFGEYDVLLNVVAPDVPLMSSGKEPNLRPMAGNILAAISGAIKRLKAAVPVTPAGSSARSQKDVIRAHLPTEAARLSGDGAYQFSLRQLFYAIRPKLIAAIGREPMYERFARVVGEYEDAHGEIDGLYRDNRGTLVHPHSGTGDGLPLGTRMVAAYARPEWQFNKILYCEKEGLFPVLRHVRWPERYDCALLTSKGFASRAAHDLLARLEGGTEPITFFCIHDADGPGTVIFESLRDTLQPHGVRVVNLGLDPAEGRAMGLDVEPVARKRRKDGKPAKVVAGRYLPKADREWLQTHRIELNAMTSPQFVAWLSRKMDAHHDGKVIPPAPVVATAFEAGVRATLTRSLEAEALRRARIGERVETAIAGHRGRLDAIAARVGADLTSALGDEPTARWAAVIDRESAATAQEIANQLVGPPKTEE
ncbi:ATP-binding protein [Fimbriiglobus ruber]|uniref:Topoisomerase 6 subunit A/Spo11 TOPRIM domain-containing protein n=1 Tax=Fimbriiglobus ruber TaxID=1908690 RepID=A0A225DEA1_9BACT|nr:ATP-binding protein [Fimbriiglobus ruber]OWK39871.1 hypothetical protein FRUB_05761 [Fimbriiglobus ruber]